MSGKEDQVRLQISLSHAYLEVARAIFHSNDPTPSSDEFKPDFTTTFSLLSVTIVYSYLAVESFTNYHFYRIHIDSVKAHEACEKLPKSTPDVNIIPIYDDFFNKFGATPLESLRLELKAKISAVCKAYNIPQLHKADPHLWQDFCDILKPARDFVVHPVPKPSVVETTMRKLIETTPAGKYAEIASNIIEYFYVRTNKSTPDWLYRNQLLQFHAALPHQDQSDSI